MAKVSARAARGQGRRPSPTRRGAEPPRPDSRGEIERVVTVLGHLAVFGWVSEPDPAVTLSVRAASAGRVFAKAAPLEYEVASADRGPGDNGRSPFAALITTNVETLKEAKLELRLARSGDLLFECSLAPTRLTPQELKSDPRLGALHRCLAKGTRPEFCEIVASEIEVKPLHAFGPLHIENAARCSRAIVVTGWIANLGMRRILVVDDALEDFVTPRDIVLRSRPDVYDHCVRDGIQVGDSDAHGFTFVLPESRGAGGSYYFVEHDLSGGVSTFFGPIEKPKGENVDLAADLMLQPFGNAFATPAERGERLYRPLIARTSEATASKKLFGSLLARDSEPVYSIIIPFYGDAFFLSCVFHLLRLLDTRYEVILVVDDPKLYPEIEARLNIRSASIPLRVVLLRNRANYGYAEANNLGANAASGEVLILMNSDILVENIEIISRAADDVVHAANLGRDVIAGFRLLYEDGTIQHVGITFERHPGQERLFVANHPMKGLPESLDGGPPIRQVPAVTGALLAISADFYRRLGGLDRAFHRGDFEDADLCLRARKSGAEVVLYAAPGLYHLERQSYSHLAGARFREIITYLNCLEFNRRWSGELGGGTKVTKRKRGAGGRSIASTNTLATTADARDLP